MTHPIDEFRPRLAELCRLHRVKTLELFGSASCGRFDAKHSDFDFLVEFEPLAPGLHAKAYFGLWFDLQDLLGREVDLVETLAIINPYFLKAVNQQRRVLYAA